MSSGGTAGEEIEVDYLNIQPGVSVDPQNVDLTSGASLDSTIHIYKNIRYNHASSTGTMTLPAASADIIGARIFFEQLGAGALQVSPNGGDTLESSPNTTGSRSLAGKYARAYAECVGASAWRLVGDL